MFNFKCLMLCGALAALCLTITLPASAASSGKPLAKTVDLSGATFTVGSKEFTEQLILGQITLELLQAAGANVNDQTGLAGSNAVRKALLSGDIDMYWEYTGTAWVNYMGHTSTKGKGNLYKQVAQEDLQKNGIKWLTPARFNDSYGIATNQETARKYKLKTLDDLGRLIENHPDAATLCTGAEFATRDDGLHGMQKAYGYKFPPHNVIRLEFALVYQQTAKGQRCKLGNVYTTDGRIPALNLVLLKDDRNFFPPYYAALNVREAVYKAHPELAKLFAPVAKALTLKAIQHLNSEVDVKGKFPQQVAHEFLVKHHFIAE